MFDLAYAMAPAAEGGGDANILMQLMPMVVIVGIFYFLLIRPQQKKAKEHGELLKALKKGDSVITQGGLYGKIAGLSDAVISLEIAKNVVVQVARGQVAGLARPNDDESR
jgi:preprotein translocase subunit YajC